ncbi:hypothetical protein CDO30_09240 [Sinorhizobium meliloti]|uniref:Uncharacterized protein n=1 Tax=Rhizobium meliloti (strain 1021) TaxID=266834 RepID=Q92LD2_RHIME|nr:Hypothetical protein SM2011_c03288 [Sinorhizobium meliloti 2011]ASP58473.1 hypothetical protein CDO30_09240 [Sinorhizobium meliloti]CAC47713.1 Hypothetical/unknown protein [Sinorhizobium meliloti 1021]PTD30469.1 hypothetical protein C5N13_02545 [Sinorhizobium meliloti]RVJ85518.1 hypothetical protein CN169_30690 [Sinorhizobium meliloti]
MGLPQLRALKTIAGFLNAKRGTPLIGVANAGKVLGLDVRRFPERGQYRPAPGTKLRDMVTAAADFFLTAAAPASLPRNLVRNYSFRIRGLVSAERVGLRLKSYFPL